VALRGAIGREAMIAALEWIALAHIVGVAVEEQSAFTAGSWPWVTIQKPLNELSVILEWGADDDF
jgi:hypothetical protein